MDKMKQSIISQILDENLKTIFYYGGWGIGKTHLFKEVIYKELKALNKEGKHIYFDVRILNIYKNALEVIMALLGLITATQKIKKSLEKIFNIASIVGNAIFKTNIPKLAKDKSFEAICKELSNQKVYLIFDELDRVDGKTILKAFNVINIIAQSSLKVKIICVGNKEEMEAVLKNSIGTEIKNGFLQKYFENQLSLEKMVKQPLYDLIAIYSKMVPRVESIKEDLVGLIKNHRDEHGKLVTARELERWFLKNEWCFSSISSGFWILSFFYLSYNKIGTEKINFDFSGFSIDQIKYSFTPYGGSGWLLFGKGVLTERIIEVIEKMKDDSEAFKNYLIDVWEIKI